MPKPNRGAKEWCAIKSIPPRIGARRCVQLANGVWTMLPFAFFHAVRCAAKILRGGGKSGGYYGRQAAEEPKQEQEEEDLQEFLEGMSYDLLVVRELMFRNINTRRANVSMAVDVATRIRIMNNKNRV